jgi:hypothetical protein
MIERAAEHGNDDTQSAEDAAERRRAANELAAILERAGE